MAYEYKGGTKGVTLTGADKGGVDKKTQSSTSLSSGVITDATNVGNPNNITSKDIKQKEVPGTFKFNPAMEQRILAAKDRQNMRIESRRQKLVGGGDDIKSQFTLTAEEGSKLYEKNLKLEKKLNKKFPQPVSTGGVSVANSNINNTPASTISNVSGATSIKPQATISKPTVQATVIDAYKKSPPASSGSSYKNSNYINKYDRSENLKNFQAKYGAKNINEWENKNSLEDKDKTNAKF